MRGGVRDSEQEVLLPNQFVSPFWRSAEEDELQYLKSRGFPTIFAKCLQQRKAYRFHQEAHSCTYTHTVTAAPRYGVHMHSSEC